MNSVEPLRQLFTSAIALLPEGGQRTARRNAWAAMSEDNRRARDRREAAAAFAVPVAPRSGASRSDAGAPLSGSAPRRAGRGAGPSR